MIRTPFAITLFITSFAIAQPQRGVEDLLKDGPMRALPGGALSLLSYEQVQVELKLSAEQIDKANKSMGAIMTKMSEVFREAQSNPGAGSIQKQQRAMDELVTEGTESAASL
jgi:hypothetical protein